jgi:hypothetical protein
VLYAWLDTPPAPATSGATPLGLTTPARRHVTLLDRCRSDLPLSETDLEELTEHVRALGVRWGYGGSTNVAYEKLDRRARALHAILELRAWWSDELPDDPEAWRGIEVLATAMTARMAQRGITMVTRPERR